MPVLIAEMPEQHIAELDRDAGNEPLIRELSPRSLICVPLLVRNQCSGR